MSTKKGYKLVPWLFGKEIEIPEEWEVKKLEEVGEIIGGGTPDSTNKDFWNGDILWAVPTDITKLQVNQIENTERKITKLGLENSSAKLLPAKTILITSRATIGECAITTKPITTNQGFQNIICNDKHNNYLIFYLIKHFPNNLLRLSQGTTFLEINKNQMKKVIVPISNDIKEQQKIATILSNVDSLIDSTSKIIKNSKSLKTGLMQKLLTRGIGHSKFKTIMLLYKKYLQVPESWSVLTGEKIFKLSSGVSPSEIVFRDDGDCLFVQVDDMNTPENKKEIVTSKLKFNSYKNQKIIVNETERIVFPKRGVAILGNKVRKLTKKSTVDPNIMMVDCDNSIIPDFFYYFLSFLKLSHLIESAGVPQLNNKDLYPRNFLKPSLPEQQKIASILSNIDAQINSQTQYKEKLERLKKSLMQKLLTGEVRVAI